MLTYKAIAALKPRAKDYPKAAGNGLCVVVDPRGRKIWRYRFRFAGKAKSLTFGDWPHVSIDNAKRQHQAARDLLQSGRDPSAERQADMIRARIASSTTFEGVAREWLELKRKDWTEKNETKERGRLENHVIPWIGKLPVAEIGTAEVRAILDRILKHRNVDTAHRVRQTMSYVFRYAIAHERAERDPAHALADFLPAHRKRQYSHIKDPKLLGELLRAIYGFTGQYATTCALKLAPMLLLRPGELRGGLWREIHLDRAEWIIPATRMKHRKAIKEDASTPPHIVPLPKQAVSILRELHRLTGSGELLFPGARSHRVPLSNMTLGAAFKRMGFGTDVIHPHGLRHSASTALHELGFKHDAIERQLSHKERGISGVYNKAEYLAERRKMMQAWADYLDALRDDAEQKVVPVPRKG